MSGEITHKGIVTTLSEKTITVSILNESACAGCHAKGSCSAADMKDKEIEINRPAGHFTIGQQVVVAGKMSQGFKAMFLGYLLPFVVVLVTLVITTLSGLPDSQGGLLALGSLVPYYAVLYALRNKIKKSFEFEIKPLQ